ncbi:hypothetical protein [Alkaliphilus crotonatoxidans]
MIKIIIGKMGSGKTRQLIEEANEAVKRAKGHIVYIDRNNNHMFQIDYRIRFTGMKDYHINDHAGFYGFLSGIIASNYDIEGIYVDGLNEITNSSPLELEDFFQKLGRLELKYNVNFTFTLPMEETVPDYLHQYKLHEVKAE